MAGSPARTLAALLTLAIGVGACTTTPSPSPSATAPATEPPTTGVPATPGPSARPLAEVYAEIRAQVAGIRGLQPTADVSPVVIDATQLAANLEKEFDATYTAAALKDAEDMLIAIGLLPPGTSLRKATLDFQGGQVAGYYSPDQNELYVVSRGARVGPADESTYAHEFTHQLQDQHVDLEGLGIDAADQSDRALARLALVEGDATSVQTTWMTQNLTAAELGEVFASALDPDALEALRNAPSYLRDTALFPYESGFALVTRLTAEGGYPAVDAAYADPPDSTEQVLHPEKYFDREAPLVVAVPKNLAAEIGGGWAEVGQDTLGELIIRSWLNQGGETIVQAPIAAAGWGGDRLALYRGPNGRTVVVLIAAWDTAQDATEFEAAAKAALGILERNAISRISGTRVAFAIGDADALAQLDASMVGLVAN